jgi:hypothetical protein
MKQIFISGFIIILILGIIGLYSILWLSSCTTTNFTVIEKERVVDSDSSKYLIFTEEEVFENTDSLLKWKFNSSDVYKDLKKDENYNCEVCGWRIQFMSMYRNIIKLVKE